MKYQVSLGLQIPQGMHQCQPAARLNKSSQRLAAICINKAYAIRTNAVIRTVPTAPDSSTVGARTEKQTALPGLLVYATDKRSNHMKAETRYRGRRTVRFLWQTRFFHVRTLPGFYSGF